MDHTYDDDPAPGNSGDYLDMIFLLIISAALVILGRAWQ